jgi:hypothetical protein
MAPEAGTHPGSRRVSSRSPPDCGSFYGLVRMDWIGMLRVMEIMKVTLLVEQIGILHRWVDEMIDGADCTTFSLLNVTLYCTLSQLP